MTPEHNRETEFDRAEILEWFRRRLLELIRTDLSDVPGLEPRWEPRLTEELFPLVLAAIANDRDRTAVLLDEHSTAARPWARTRRALPELAQQLRSSANTLSAPVLGPLEPIT
ncbi:hypothetical protein LZ318_31025 [Saccharopolyspora indica]|uniref:hypothetical protein n=1 Tax=Saccharopolyspora indica TaxID=1229659 RepID=UPI0022EAA9B3|nr:hypothetical protein [Saccharopolyspora indica]MDA3644333.1 hypothetical protein [Saccharopolyspora indica]